MIELFLDCLYSCCFGIRRRRSKLHDTIKNIEELTQEEFDKVMNIYKNNSSRLKKSPLYYICLTSL